MIYEAKLSLGWGEVDKIGGSGREFNYAFFVLCRREKLYLDQTCLFSVKEWVGLLKFRAQRIVKKGKCVRVSLVAMVVGMVG